MNLDSLTCVDGMRSNDWRSYISSWITGDINAGINVLNRNRCMKLAQENVENSVGIYWSHDVGVCRAIIDVKPLLPWPKSFPDYQSRIKLCVLKNVITDQGMN